MAYCESCGANCDGCQTVPTKTNAELTALKAEIARMQPVFDAAVKSYHAAYNGSADEYDNAVSECDELIRKLDR